MARSSAWNRIRVLWPDLLGLARGKYLPARRAPDATGHCIALFALGFDGNMTPHDGAYYYQGTPDLEARFGADDVRPGWEPETGLAIPDVFKDDQPVPMAPRHVLRRAVEEWKSLGYEVRIGVELEAYLMQRGVGREWIPIDTPGGYVYGTGRAVDPRGVLDDVMTTAEDVGLKLESVHSEYDNGQFELTLEHDDALAACDDAFLFKVMAREVAGRHDCLLTFLGKPYTEHGGSGTHINLSLEKDGANAFADKETDDGLSDLARQVLGGLLEHQEGMTAVCAPTVNAYKRLRPGQMSGYWVNWGYDHRGCAIRVPPGRGRATRLEHRVSDGSVNPHIATAAILQAARLGVVHRAEAPPAETGDGWEKVDIDRHVPRSLEAALDALERDDAFVSALGEKFVDAFLVVKRAEWERYAAHTTDWETKEYLHFI